MLFCYWILSQWLNLHWVTHQPLLLTAPLPNTAKPLIAIFTFSFYFGQGFEPLICAFLLIINPGCNEEHNRSVSGRVLCERGDLWSTCWRANERLWLLASLEVSCALKGRRALSKPNMSLQERFSFLYARCCQGAGYMDALREVLRGDLGLCKLSQSPALNNLPLISRLQSYCNQCSLLALCGINVSEINIILFFFIRPLTTVISFFSQNWCALEFNFLLILISWKYNDW